MIRNYFKIAWRNLIKNKGYSMINIGGLAIGITAYILIIQYVNFESSYDQHQPQIDDLYRVTLTSNLGSKGFVTSATNHPAVGVAMKQDFPEVENFTRVVDKSVMTGNFVLSYKNEQGVSIKSNVSNDMIYIADSTIFDLFNIPLIKGNPKTALSKPLSLVLSTSAAQRFFGDEDPINKTLIANNRAPVKITGVFEELQENTHLKFDMLISLSSMGPRASELWVHPEYYNYVRLKKGTDPAKVEAKFPAFVDKYLSEIMQKHGFEARFGLQPVKDIHLKSHHLNEIGVNANEKTLNLLKIIAVFVILIALMNFINLSTAKSTERAMEVGLKKVVGIKKSALIGQFLFESLIINLLAAIIAIALISLLMNPFNQLVGYHILSYNLWFQPNVWMHLIALVILGGLLAGAYPAFVLSGFKPIQVLKGKLHQSGSGSLMRKALVIIQFSISIALITGTFIMYSQFSYMRNQELGFDVDHNLVINAPRVIDSTINSRLEVFKNELLNNSKINSVAASNEVPGKKLVFYNTTRQVHEQQEASVICNQLSIDHNFLETYQIKVIAGRNFRLEDRTSYGFRGPVDPDKKSYVMVNRAASKLLGFASVEDALNKKIIFQLGPEDRTAEILGVTENYHQQSLQNDYEPIVYLFSVGYNASYLSINMNTSNAQNTIADIENKYAEFFPMDPFDYFFLDDHFNLQYNADIKFGQIFFLFAGLAIFIAALGLFGLGSYMAMRKTKELCIRKVLGANELQVMVLIPKSLLILVLISGIIVVPIIFYVASNWLANYAFRVELNPWMFIAPLLLVLVVAGVSVLPESIKVAFLKPANYLRNE